jgi:hypothetical protein
VNGAEEDGVDNRVQAPARVPGEGSEGTSSAAEDSAGASSAAAANTSAEASLPGETSSGANSGAANGGSVNGSATYASAANGSAANGSAANGSPTAQRGQPAFIPAPAATSNTTPGMPMAVVSGAANGAKGLASKVGAGFSGLTKPRPKPARPPARKPAKSGKQGQALPPRTQPGRPQDAGQPSRSAMLSLQRLEPMSVMKFSSLVALVCWVVIFVAVAVIYFALSKLGVFAKIEDTVGLVTANKAHPGANAASWFSASRTMEYTAIVCTVNAVLFTALATVGAALYNLVASLTGGIEVTLKESD